MPRASLVQDLYLGFEPRLRARRLAPWLTPPARLLLELDLGESLEEPVVAAALEALAERVEVIAWEPRPSPTNGVEPLSRAQQLAREGGRRFGERPLFVAGHGLGGWIALAAAAVDGVRGAVALAPSLAKAGPSAPQPSALRAALAESLAQTTVDRPVLVLEGRERPAAEARLVDEWLARNPRATRLVAAGDDRALLSPPWPQLVANWVAALGDEAR